MAKKFLRIFFGVVLALVSLLCLIAFIVYCSTPRAPFAPKPATIGFVFMWIVILGSGIGSFFLFRAVGVPQAVGALLGKGLRAAGFGGSYEDDDAKGDYDEEEEPRKEDTGEEGTNDAASESHDDTAE